MRLNELGLTRGQGWDGISLRIFELSQLTLKMEWTGPLLQKNYKDVRSVLGACCFPHAFYLLVKGLFGNWGLPARPARILVISALTVSGFALGGLTRNSSRIDPGAVSRPDCFQLRFALARTDSELNL